MRTIFVVLAGLLCLLPATAGADPLGQTVSARIFAGPLTPDALVESYSFPYHFHAEVRGALACDTWSISVNAPGGGSFTRSGGAVQDIALTGSVAPGSVVQLTADVTCKVGGVAATVETEPLFVDGPKLPDPAPPLPNPTQTVLPQLRQDLGAIARTSSHIALATCRRPRDRTRGRATGLLYALCVTTSWQALTAAGTGRPAGDLTDGEAARPPSLPAVEPTRADVCPLLRRSACTAAMRSISAALADERALAGALDALDRSITDLRSAVPGEDPINARAGAVAYYSDSVAVLVAKVRGSRRALAALVKRMRADVTLRGRGLSAARRAFATLAGLPTNVLADLSRGALRRDAAALVARRPRPTTLRLTQTLRAQSATAGLVGQARQVDWNILVGAAQDYGGVGGAVDSFSSHLDRRSKLCDLGQRSQEAHLGLQGLVADHRRTDWLLDWLSTRVAPPVESSPPAGCTAPGAPVTDTFNAFGSFGTGPGQLDRPTDIAVGPGGIYVADQGNSRIERFSLDGQFISAWGARPIGAVPLADGQFFDPVGVALDGSGNVYVSDFHGDRVQKFTSNGTLLTRWGSTGSGDGQFIRTAGIAVGSNGDVYVVDPGNERVQVFDQNGTFLNKFGTSGSGPGQFTTPRGMGIDAAGNVYVADRNTGRVEVFSAGGMFIRQFGRRGLDPGTFNGVYDIAVDPQGNLWIADLYNYWMQHFTPTGQFLGLVDSFGADRQPFNPFAVATDQSGRVYVADIDGGTGDRILVFNNPQ